MSQPIRIGLLRLVDSAPVLVAQQRGLFEQLGLNVRVSIEPSWSNLADKLTYGVLDAAVMLPPLVLAAAMGLRGPAAKMVVAMGLSQGGNTIVVGRRAARMSRPPNSRPGGWCWSGYGPTAAPTAARHGSPWCTISLPIIGCCAPGSPPAPTRNGMSKPSSPLRSR